MEEKSLSPIVNLRLSWWIYGMVVLVFITMAEQVNSQTPLRTYCRSQEASNGEFYLINLNTTLSSLRLQLSNPQVYYAFAQATDNDQYVYNFALCREYLSTSRCLACFDSAVNETKACRTADGGNVIYDDCSIRYQNSGQIFDNTEAISVYDESPRGVCGYESASQPVTYFNQVVEELISDIRVATPRTSDFYVASTRQVSTTNVTVYAIAQCVQNIPQAICQNCLTTAYNNLRSCLPNTEGRAIDFVCFMKYALAPFFLTNQTTNISPFLSEGSSTSSTKSGMIVGVSSGVGLFLLILALWLWYRRRKKSKTVGEDKSGLQGANCYSYQDLRLATHNFGEEYRIGKGGFGEVFKAIIDDENVVAVKRLHVGCGKAKLEFDNEVKLLSNIQHRNLVRQLGWSSEGPELLLVLEYMPQGSLDRFLWGEKRGTLNWRQRFDIIFGIARGLAHLHEEYHVKIIHRDIKSNNILLDNYFQPKIADFGLARFHPEDQTHVSTQFAGTLGYTAPEYATRGRLTEKVDIYSFGIVALEIISGWRCTDVKLDGLDSHYLLEQAWQLYEKEMHNELIDETLDQNDYEEEHVMKIIEIALMCTQSSPVTLRPSMSEVVLMLSIGKSLGRKQIIRPTFINPDRRVNTNTKGLQKYDMKSVRVA